MILVQLLEPWQDHSERYRTTMYTCHVCSSKRGSTGTCSYQPTCHCSRQVRLLSTQCCRQLRPIRAVPSAAGPRIYAEQGKQPQQQAHRRNRDSW